MYTDSLPFMNTYTWKSHFRCSNIIGT